MKKIKVNIGRPPFILGFEPESCPIGESCVALMKVKHKISI
jgi:hypothetical protein